MIHKVFYRSPHNYDLEAASNEAAIPPDGHGISNTIQSMAEDADINVLMRRFGVTGQLPSAVRLPSYGDFTGVRDFQSALQAVRQAAEDFMTLPADLRFKFGNDPQAFLQAVEDGSALAALEASGLAKRVVPSTPPSGGGVTPPAAPAAS